MVDAKSIPPKEYVKSSLGQGANLVTQPVLIQKTQRNLYLPHSQSGFKNGCFQVTNSRAWRRMCVPRLDPVLGQGTDFIGAEVDYEHLARPHLAVLVLLPAGLLHLHTASTLVYS